MYLTDVYCRYTLIKLRGKYGSSYSYKLATSLKISKRKTILSGVRLSGSENERCSTEGSGSMLIYIT